ncbi:MAG: divergent polysaccharide deacetylase family protein [Treponema sp.]|nr:divergent polysaccharide deacetylase family protein [Treponema sp.]
MAQKKKKPKVVLKKSQVIVLAATIVAVCACMLTVVTLTALKSQTDSPTTAQKEGASVQAPSMEATSSEITSIESLSPEGAAPKAASSEASSQEAINQQADIGVAQVIAQLEAAEKRAKEAEARAKEAEKRASKAQSDAETAQKQATAALEAQKRAAQQQQQQQAASNVASRGSISSGNISSENPSSGSASSGNLALGSKDASASSSTGKPSSTTGSSSSPSVVVGKDYTIPPARSGATLAFVFDDGGQNLSDLQHYLNLPFPVDVAVLPQLQHSVESARRVRSSGRHELLLHQPMQALNLSVNPGPGAISPSMTTTDIDAVVRKNLAEIGPVSGLNNHEGSLITESKIKIGKVIEICQQQGIFFLDSRTTVNTAAPQAALELGAKIWERDVFLDNTQNRADILEQIQRGLEVANKKGYAIYIGHVWSGSNLAQILQELYPVLKSQGYIFSTVGGLYENFGN